MKKYIAGLKPYKSMLNLLRLVENKNWNKFDKQEKTVRPGVRG